MLGNWFASLLKPWQSFAAAQIEGIAKTQSQALDRLAYDLARLSDAERDWLAERPGVPGTILVVLPRSSRGPVAIRRHGSHAAFRETPGQPIRHFTIAGAGGSELGAAAFARVFADFLGEPVGAIVAGYPPEQAMTDVMGGAFLFSHALRPLAALQTARHIAAQSLGQQQGALPPPDPAEYSLGPEASALIRILTDPDRKVMTLAAHSKGALALGFALRRLALLPDRSPARRLAEALILTVGTVVTLPPSYRRVVQLLGSMDAVGFVNSRPGLDHAVVEGAGHHLNPAFPGHLDLGAELERLFSGVAPLR